MLENNIIGFTCVSQLKRILDNPSHASLPFAAVFIYIVRKLTDQHLLVLTQLFFIPAMCELNVGDCHVLVLGS